RYCEVAIFIEEFKTREELFHRSLFPVSTESLKTRHGFYVLSGKQKQELLPPLYTFHVERVVPLLQFYKVNGPMERFQPMEYRALLQFHVFSWPQHQHLYQ